MSELKSDTITREVDRIIHERQDRVKADRALVRSVIEEFTAERGYEFKSMGDNPLTLAMSAEGQSLPLATIEARANVVTITRPAPAVGEPPIENRMKVFELSTDRPQQIRQHLIEIAADALYNKCYRA